MKNDKQQPEKITNAIQCDYWAKDLCQCNYLKDCKINKALECQAPLSNETKVVESDHRVIKTKGHLGGTTPPYINEMMEEKKICGITCGCTNEHDCYGEAALNFIELGENKISLSFSIVDETIINGAKYTEKQAVELAMKIMNHYYTDNVD